MVAIRLMSTFTLITKIILIFLTKQSNRLTVFGALKLLIGILLILTRILIFKIKKKFWIDYSYIWTDRTFDWCILRLLILVL